MIDSRVFADVLIEGVDDWVPIDQLLWAAQEGGEVVQLVLDDLERLSWEPKLGSRAWIANTEAGDEAAQQLSYVRTQGSNDHAFPINS